MKYGEIIRDLASRGLDWQMYDENFRKQSRGGVVLVLCLALSGFMSNTQYQIHNIGIAILKR